MDRVELEKWYGALKGMREFSVNNKSVPVSMIGHYNEVVEKISEIVGEKLDNFKITNYYTYYAGGKKTYAETLQSKLLPFLSFLEHGYKLSEKVIEIGSVYNSIEDTELKERCSDILSAPSDFDRVINQATQVLENRIRTKSGVGINLSAVALVNKVLNTNPERTILLISDDPGVHEGICHICRGIMMSFRNPTHHTLSKSKQITREDALKFTAFIDYILKILDESEIIEENR